MTGQSITVNEGGAYQVIYTAPSGCKVVGNVQVPLSLESLMWVFPTGCYDECLRKNYVLGPKGVFDHHDWLLFGNSIQRETMIIFIRCTLVLQELISCRLTIWDVSLLPEP